jgi:CRISPR/Cas system-associated protein Cas10 (large subunit of type III CRISPR-Cas system)
MCGLWYKNFNKCGVCTSCGYKTEWCRIDRAAKAEARRMRELDFLLEVCGYGV